MLLSIAHLPLRMLLTIPKSACQILRTCLNIAQLPPITAIVLCKMLSHNAQLLTTLPEDAAKYCTNAARLLPGMLPNGAKHCRITFNYSTKHCQVFPEYYPNTVKCCCMLPTCCLLPKCGGTGETFRHTSNRSEPKACRVHHNANHTHH